MSRAIEFARQAEGNTSPNPPVGCVIVKDDAIVGEGFTQPAGLDHAEVVAIKNAAGKTAGATMYITLEPCKHFGRTPPCTTAIIDAKLSKVVIATEDPNPSAGGGASLLEANGITIIRDVLAAESQHQNRFYLHAQKHKAPFVIGKYAASLDGRIATRTGHSQWITGEVARQRGHELRQSIDAILVGSQTVIDDNPRLTTRVLSASFNSESISHPLRVVLDGSARVPLDCQLYTGELPGKTLVVTSSKMSDAVKRTLIDRHVDVVKLPTIGDSQHINLRFLLEELYKRSILSLLVEGGQAVLGSFLDEQLINEMSVFLAPTLIGGIDSPAAIGGMGIDRLSEAPLMTGIRSEQLGNDYLINGTLVYPQRP